MPVFLSLTIKNFQGFSGTISSQQTTGLIGKEATGKTAFFRALSIIRTLVLGYSIPEDFCKYIRDNTEISAEFKLGEYHFWYKIGLGQDTERTGNIDWWSEEKTFPQIKFERLECKWPGNKKRELIAEAKVEDNIYQVFGPQTKQKLFLGHKRSGVRTAAWVERQVKYRSGCSFLFSNFMFMKYKEASEAAKAAFPTEGIRLLNTWAAEHWLILSSHPAKDSMLVKYCGSWHVIRKTKMEQTRYIEGTVLTEEAWASFQKNLIRVNEILVSCTGAILKVKSVFSDSAYQKGFSINDIVIEHHDGSISIDEASESLSTLAQLCWMLPECNGEDNLVVIDDLDKNINDELLVSIVECFKKAKGQVVFTSLSSAPLRPLSWREAWFTQAYRWSANYVQTGPTTNLFNKYVNGNDDYYAELKDMLTR